MKSQTRFSSRQTMLSAFSAFAPPLRPQPSPSTMAPRAVCMLDPGFIDAGMIGRASTFGLACYAVAQIVDPPGVRRRDEAAMRFGWLNADMSVPLPTLQTLEDSCVRVGQLRGCAALPPRLASQPSCSTRLPPLLRRRASLHSASRGASQVNLLPVQAEERRLRSL